jgi:hypothetical protein
MKQWNKAVLVGYVIYKTKSQRKVERDFDLGSVELMAVNCLDLEAIKEMLKTKFEDFKKNKVDYELVEMFVRVWTSGYDYKDYKLN